MVRLPLVGTGSKSDILRRCGWPLHNPCVEPAPAGEGAKLGSEGHAYVEGSVVGEVMPEGTDGAALGKGCVEEWDARIAAGALPLPSTKHEGSSVVGYSEVTVAWDSYAWKGTLVGERLDRNYPEADKHVVFATMDLVYMEPDGTLVVIDLKSDSDGTEFVEDHSQLLLCSLALASALSAKKVRGEIWGMRWHKRPWVERAEYTWPQMYEVAGQIEANYRNVQATAMPGQHCKWCPANGQCPATEQSLTGLAEMPSKWNSAIVDMQHAAWMVERLPLVKKALDNIEKELKKYADEVGGIPLADGKTYRSSSYKKNSFNTTAAKARLEELGELDKYMQQIDVTQYRARKS